MVMLPLLVIVALAAMVVVPAMAQVCTIGELRFRVDAAAALKSKLTPGP